MAVADYQILTFDSEEELKQAINVLNREKINHHIEHACEFATRKDIEFFLEENPYFARKVSSQEMQDLVKNVLKLELLRGNVSDRIASAILFLERCK